MEPKICQFNENYLIYPDGKVFSLIYGKLRLLKPDKRDCSYPRVTLSKNGKTTRVFVHRLVATHFIPNPYNLPVVNHIDGNKNNCHVSNLEWCTVSQNEIHSYKVLGKINPNRKFTIEQVNEIRESAIYKVGRGHGNIKELSRKYNVNIRTIYNIVTKVCYADS